MITRRAIILVILLALAITSLFIRTPNVMLSGWAKKSAVETPDKMSAIASIPNKTNGWPPQLGSQFPEVGYYDHSGQPFSFVTLQGKPTLIEFVAMTCAACQAWSGAHKYGAFHNFAAQEDLRDIEGYYQRFTNGLNLFSGEINFVQLVNYDTNLEAPSAEALATWRKHFHFDEHANVFVISSGEALRNKDTYVRTPGFMLLDKNGIVRFDALGHTPHHDLYRELLPGVRELLGDQKADKLK